MGGARGSCDHRVILVARAALQYRMVLHALG